MRVHCCKKTLHHGASSASSSFPEKNPYCILDHLNNWTVRDGLPTAVLITSEKDSSPFSKMKGTLWVSRVCVGNLSSRSSDKRAAQGRAWSLSRRGSARRTKVRNREGGTVGDSKQKQVYHPHQHIKQAGAQYQLILECVENCKYGNGRKVCGISWNCHIWKIIRLNICPILIYPRDFEG
jgi:hypothetical protein